MLWFKSGFMTELNDRMCGKMCITCRYDKNIEIFLRDLVSYTIKKYHDEIDISNLKSIELIDSAEIDLKTDGRTCEDGTKIILTSRLFDKLPEYNITTLEDNKVFVTIVNTLFHEMGHVTDWAKYPNIYNCASNLEEDKRNGIPSLFWLEYLAEKRSCSQIDYTDYCNSFVTINWRPTKACLYDYFDSTNFVYLNKHLPYFIARKENNNNSKMYLEKIKNQILVNYIIELEDELKVLENQLPFDDVDRLSYLYEIMNKYFNKFNIKLVF